jgi:hypothetical protein
VALTLGGRPIPGSAAPDSPKAALGFGCMVLFLLPFATVGVITAGMAVQRAVQENWYEMLFFTLFAVTFGGVGLGGIAFTLLARRKLKEQDALKARHPTEPWQWQKDWAAGRIDDTGRTTMWVSWVFATFWNLVSLPIGYVGVRDALQKGNNAGYVALVFPLVGMGLLAWAIRTTLRYKKYGISRLELATIPGTIGRTLAGTVRTNTVLQPADGFQVTLSCVRRVTTRSGKNSSTTESTLWQEERNVRGEPSRDASGLGMRIPVAFRLPNDVRACDSSDPNDRILWRLTLSASVPGIDYDSAFEVPVFRTEASDRPLSEDEERQTRVPAGAEYKQPIDSRVTVTRNRRGTEIGFPAARNPGVAIGSTVFTLIWLAIVWALFHFNAPVIFPVVFGLFGLVLIFGTLQIWLGVSRVTVDAGTLSVATGYLAPGRERRLALGEIADVSIAIGMQAGSRPYYDVVILRKNGKKVIAGRALRDKREAEWLAATIKSALGLESKPAAA